MQNSEMMRHMERTVLLQFIDQYWKEHLLNLDKLRQGINLRAYGQRDPLNEYKQEAFSLFEMMSATIRKETIKALSLFELPSTFPTEKTNLAVLDGRNKKKEFSPFDRHRNAACPCGSGEKYKHCCGKIEFGDD